MATTFVTLENMNPETLIAKQSTPTTKSLLDVLAKMHIIPFDEQAVLKYKEKKLDIVPTEYKPSVWTPTVGLHYPGVYRREDVDDSGMIRHAEEKFTPDGSSVCLLLVRRYPTKTLAVWQNPTGTAAKGNVLIQKMWWWDRLWIGHGQGSFNQDKVNLPVEIRGLIAEISAQYPNADFAVEALRDDAEVFYDPFLIVGDINEPSDKWFYIRCWDETYSG